MKLTKAKLKHPHIRAGQKLHKVIAQGGNPANFNRLNNTESLRRSSKHPSGK